MHALVAAASPHDNAVAFTTSAGAVPATLEGSGRRRARRDEYDIAAIAVAVP